MKMKHYTIQDILSWNPCSRYTEKSLQKLFGKRRSVTLVDILCADISDLDAIWAACHAVDDERQLRLFICDCVEAVIELTSDTRISEAIRVARLYAYGRSTVAELDAVWDSVHACYWDYYWGVSKNFDSTKRIAAAACRATLKIADQDVSSGRSPSGFALKVYRAGAFNAASIAAISNGDEVAVRVVYRQALLMLALTGEIE